MDTESKHPLSLSRLRRALAGNKSKPATSSTAYRPPTRPKTSTGSGYRTEQPPPSKSRTVEIKIALPKLPSYHGITGSKRLKQASGRLAAKFKPHVQQVKNLRPARLLSTPKSKLATASVFVLIAGLAVYLTVLKPNTDVADTATSSKANQSSSSEGESTTLAHGTPDYKTLLPAGKKIDQLGGWSRVSPPDRNPVYAFADKIDSVQIAVSQQPLPADFKEDTASQVEQLAKNYKATEKLTVGSTLVYIGNSIKGQQSVILTKADLLILIKSDSPLTITQWNQYIGKLE